MQRISCPPRVYNLVWDVEQAHVKAQQLWTEEMKLCCQMLAPDLAAFLPILWPFRCFLFLGFPPLLSVYSLLC